MNNLTKSRITIVVVALLFFVPVPLSWIVYFYGDQLGWQPEGRSNYGTLVTPAQPLKNRDFETLDGEKFALEQFKGKWTLLTISKAGCDKPCQDNVHKMRQVRLALHREFERVQRALITADPDTISGMPEFLEAFEGTLFLKGGQHLAEFESVLNSHTTADANLIYVIDPLGNLMMYYAADANPSSMLKDLKRLLKLSNIG